MAKPRMFALVGDGQLHGIVQVRHLTEGQLDYLREMADHYMQDLHELDLPPESVRDAAGLRRWLKRKNGCR